MTNAETDTETDTAATVAEPGAHVAPEKAPSKKGATRKKDAPKGRKTAKAAKANAAPPKKEARAGKKAAKTAPAKKTSAPRAESKGAKIIELIGRAKGATLAAIMEATGWQAHSVRGFISGTLGKKMGLKVVSAKREDGTRAYTLAK